MILYLDTSAFLKLYVEEPGSSHVRETVAGARGTFTHLITYAEMHAGFAKAMRMGRLAKEETTYQVACFEKDWQAIRAVGVDEPLIRRAGDLALTCGLRGYDSVHLAAAEAVWRITGTQAPFLFVVFDAALAESARALGMQTIGD